MSYTLPSTPTLAPLTPVERELLGALRDDARLEPVPFTGSYKLVAAEGRVLGIYPSALLLPLARLGVIRWFQNGEVYALTVHGARVYDACGFLPQGEARR